MSVLKIKRSYAATLQGTDDVWQHFNESVPIPSNCKLWFVEFIFRVVIVQNKHRIGKEEAGEMDCQSVFSREA